MSSDRIQKQIDNLLEAFTELKKESQALLLKEINKELEAFLPEENNGNDETNEVFDFLSQLSVSVQEEFDELLAGDSDKKRFVRALSRIFALLLNTKLDTAKKIKRITKVTIETTLKIWQELRQQ